MAQTKQADILLPTARACSHRLGTGIRGVQHQDGDVATRQGLLPHLRVGVVPDAEARDSSRVLVDGDDLHYRSVRREQLKQDGKQTHILVQNQLRLPRGHVAHVS